MKSKKLMLDKQRKNELGGKIYLTSLLSVQPDSGNMGAGLRLSLMTNYRLWRGNFCFSDLQSRMNSGVLYWRKPMQSEFEQNNKLSIKIGSTAHAVILLELQASWIIWSTGGWHIQWGNGGLHRGRVWSIQSQWNEDWRLQDTPQSLSEFVSTQLQYHCESTNINLTETNLRHSHKLVSQSPITQSFFLPKNSSCKKEGSEIQFKPTSPLKSPCPVSHYVLYK